MPIKTKEDHNKAGVGLNICVSNNNKDDWLHNRQHNQVCLRFLDQHIYLRCHTGMEVCLAATPVEQGLNQDPGFSFWHSVVIFRHTKQNCTLHCVQPTFLQRVPSCRTSRPQVGQARVDGHFKGPSVSFTLLRTTSGHVFNMSNELWKHQDNK